MIDHQGRDRLFSWLQFEAELLREPDANLFSLQSGPSPDGPLPNIRPAPCAVPA
jgi:hypothetical protein